MRFVKFLGVGGTATLIQYTILVVLVEFFSTLPVIASTIGFVTSSTYNYLLNYYFTFGSQARHHVASAKFALVATLGLTINSAIIFLLTEWLTVHYIVAQAIATLVVLIWNFLAHQHWTYKSTGGV